MRRSLDLLRCPACRNRPLHPDGTALRCPDGHTYDIARHGYVSLLTGTRARSGDDAPMARAREQFLATGKYAPIRRTVADLAARSLPERGTVLDAGCGTGHYLAGVLDRAPHAHGLGLDTSVRALRRAARTHARAAAATWDLYRPLPLADRTADVVLNVFAPRNPAEFHRVLRPTGRLIVVRPTGRHLRELRQRTPGMVDVDPGKEQRLHRALTPYFTAERTERVEYAMALTAPQTSALLGMTPSARHLNPSHIEAADSPEVTVSVLATVYRPLHGDPHDIGPGKTRCG
ncbi:methyltransferase domain-containing protein [Streptomyces sp. NPDC088789]|uniref:methyltransferase domain-containing protein n=1 Tax=Streptomyces sp. NPDC088789 TaxID=3365899 RepID=UPI0038209167